MSLYYILNEDNTTRNATTDEYNEWFYSGNRRHFLWESKFDEAQILVYTCFLDYDHGFDNEESILFETMVCGGDLGNYQRRYHTYAEAEAGHGEAVRLVQEALLTREADRLQAIKQYYLGENYRDVLKDDVQWLVEEVERLRQETTKSTFSGGRVPYGYRYVKSSLDPCGWHLEINEDAAAIVQQIFELHSVGFTTPTIAAKLNCQGALTAEGKSFTPTAVWRIVKHRDIYSGKAPLKQQGATRECAPPILT